MVFDILDKVPTYLWLCLVVLLTSWLVLLSVGAWLAKRTLVSLDQDRRVLAYEHKMAGGLYLKEILRRIVSEFQRRAELPKLYCVFMKLEKTLQNSETLTDIGLAQPLAEKYPMLNDFDPWDYFWFVPEGSWPEDLSDHLDSGFLIERFEDILRYLHASGLMFPSWDEILRCLKDVWCPDETELSP